MEWPTPHRRQFIIGRHPIQRDGWCVRTITDSMYLSHCRTLPVTEVDLGNGKYGGLILGLPVQTHPCRHTPAEEAGKALDDIERTYDSWAGRWIFLTKTEVHGDISGLFGCYYSIVDGCLWVSSSVALLSEAVGGDWPRHPPLSRKGMNWYPPPMSRHPKVRKLLPSQVLQLSSGGVRPRQLFPDEKLRSSESEALSAIEVSLTTGLRWLERNGYTIWLGLSAGYDSRLLLAAAIQAGVPIKAYTMRKENQWRNRLASTSLVSQADMTLPPLIARSVGVPHRWIEAGPVSEEKLATFDEHTYGQTIENDRVYYARGQWDWTVDGDAILLGHVAGVGTGYWYGKLHDGVTMPKKQSILRWFQLNDGSVHGRAIAEYLAWEAQHSIVFPARVDWRDRFHLEQRISGWCSAGQQGLDLVKGERVQLINSQQLLCSMLSLSKENRVTKRFLTELIGRMAPELNAIPYNPQDTGLYRLKKVAIAVSRRSGRQTVRSVRRRLMQRIWKLG
jgi:hypothetical protein